MKIKFEVTQEHIDKGQRSDCQECPVALSLTGLGYKNVVVGLTLTFLFIDNKEYYFANPAHLKNYIQMFDRGYNLEPQIFEVEMEEY